ncbi:acyltransferase family protein, partial [Glaciecola sp. SC05]|uniref:acyltransferase family protein n=1 Tax=Glaciecola sp. SC05 TaxID=1987355 RepID=UPI003527E639
MVVILEILRGLAALWVFVFHVKDSIFLLDSTSIFYRFLDMGYLGVPMFFVISGYVITFSAESHISSNKSPLVFIKKRLWRVYPTLCFSIFLIVLLPVIFEFLSLIKTGNFSSPLVTINENLQKYSLFEWANVFLLTKIFWQQYDSLAGEFAGVNTVYWSLAIEVQFYFVVALMMCFKQHFKKLVFCVSILSLASVLFPIPLNDGFFLKFWLPFSFGIVVAYLVKAERVPFSSGVTPLYLMVCVGYTMICIVFFYKFSPNDMTLGVDLGNLLFSLLFGVGLVLLYPIEVSLVTFNKTRVGLFLLRPFLILGSMSYSVYLLHTKLYVIATSFTNKIFETKTIEFGMVTILLTLILCYPVYYFIEKKFMSSNLKSIGVCQTSCR